MSDTSISSGATLAAQKYMDKVFMEYVSKIVFKGFMGADSSKPIFVNEDLTKGKGEAVTVPLALQIDGAGISGGDYESIFALFRRDETSGAVGGAGLGLAIVREIAERHMGRVWAEPGDPRGTKFYLSITKKL